MSALPVPLQHRFFTESEKAAVLEYILYNDEQADICVDIESNHAKVHLADWKIHGVGFCVDEARVYIDDLELCKEILDEIIRQNRRVIGHNFKFDQQGLRKAKLIDDFLYNYVDTFIVQNMVDENLHENQIGLKILIKTHYGYQMGSWAEESLYDKKTGWSNLDTPRFHFYGCDDVYWNLKFWKEKLEPEFIEGKFEDLWEKVVRMGAIYVIEMEERGMQVNLQETRERMVRWAEIRQEVEREIRKMIGKDINIGSNHQLKDLFFSPDKWGLKTDGLKLTQKGSVSLDEEGLTLLHEKYGKKYPALDKIVRWRNCNKMIGTYLLPNAQMAIDNGDGRVYPSIFLTTVTGRKRCKAPNLQNQPNIYKDIEVNGKVWKKEDLGIRRCYEAPAGKVHIVSDLSQAELRLCAHISGDPAMSSAYLDWSCGKCGSSGSEKRLLTKCPSCGNEADENFIKKDDNGNSKAPLGFWHGKDIHQMTADATGIGRSDSKSVNFAAIYGASEWTMEKQFGVYPAARWGEILKGFFRLYAGIKRWHKWTELELENTGEVRDLFGRRRIITPKMLKVFGKRALNMAVNMPVQGSGAHYLMVAERKIREEFIKLGYWQTVIYPILEVHDEIVFECDEKYAEECASIIQYWMRYAVQLDVPMDSDIAITKSWGLCK